MNARHIGTALAAFLLVIALQRGAREGAVLLPIEHRSSVTSIARLVGPLCFGVLACFVSFRKLAAGFAALTGAIFLAFALGDLRNLGWMSVPLLTSCAALEVVSYLLVLDSILYARRIGGAFWLLKDVLRWSSALFPSSLNFGFLHWGCAAVCALLLGIVMTTDEPTPSVPGAGRRLVLLPLASGGAVNLALALFMVSINGPVSATAVGGPFVIASMAGQVAALLLSGLVALEVLNQKGSLEWAGSLLVGATFFLPWAILSDAPGLGVLSGMSYGVVAGASSLLLLAFVRALPRGLQAQALAAWFCGVPAVDFMADWLGEGALVFVPRIALGLTAGALIAAAGLALLRAPRNDSFGSLP